MCGLLQVSEGDCVSVMPAEPKVPLYIARVVSMWEDAIGGKYFHASWFMRGGETVLGETSDPCELFLVDWCNDTLLSAVMGKVYVEWKTHPSDWRMLGGHEELENESGEQEDENKFFFQKWYEQDTARFEDPPLEYLEVSDHGVCQCCVRNMRKVRGNHEYVHVYGVIQAPVSPEQGSKWS